MQVLKHTVEYVRYVAVSAKKPLATPRAREAFEKEETVRYHGNCAYEIQRSVSRVKSPFSAAYARLKFSACPLTLCLFAVMSHLFSILANPESCFNLALLLAMASAQRFFQLEETSRQFQSLMSWKPARCAVGGQKKKAPITATSSGIVQMEKLPVVFTHLSRQFLQHTYLKGTCKGKGETSAKHVPARGCSKIPLVAFIAELRRNIRKNHPQVKGFHH